jgi:AcrR family transcriptional regulator
MSETTGKTPRTVLDPAERREALVDAAERAYAERGISKTTVSDVARAAGVTRGLVYNYFPTTQDLVDAVLDRRVEAFADSVRAWDERRTVGDIDQALRDVIALLRAQIGSADPLRVDLHRVENAALYQRFLDRAVAAVVDTLQITTVEAYSARHGLAIEHVRETFVVLVHGLVGLVRTQPGVPDTVLAALVRQTLRLDMVGRTRAADAPTD